MRQLFLVKINVVTGITGVLDIALGLSRKFDGYIPGLLQTTDGSSSVWRILRIFALHVFTVEILFLYPQMKIRYLLLSAAMSIALITACADSGARTDYAAFVNPLTGSGGHGHVFVGASVPHGMVQLGPDNNSTGWDWCSGYHDSDSTIIGFAHTHLSGTGIADLGDVIFMPVTGVSVDDGVLQNDKYVSTFSKSNELVVPGYYSVVLDRTGITAELTASDRVGFHRYTYPDSANALLVIDLANGAKSLESRKGVTGSDVEMADSVTVRGFRSSDEWAHDHKVYFCAEFSRPILSFDIVRDGCAIKALLDFGPLDRPLEVRTGISYTSVEGAAGNLASEGRRADFDTMRGESYSRWNKALSVIDFEAAEETKRIFYTALYHTMIAPSLFDDSDGMYRGADGNIHRADVFRPYTVFSLWDTYRAVHPLYTLIDSRVSDYINSLIDISARQKSLPVWHLVGNETNCMVGIHSVPVIADACLKHVPGIDIKAAYREVARIDSMQSAGLEYVRQTGYIPSDKVPWSVARGLEYCIDYYSAAGLAAAVGRQDDYKRYMAHAGAYRHYFDSVTGFMRGKLADGSRRSGFDPSHSLHLEDDYVEGNAWQYTWLVPHDPEGLIALMGGKQRFEQKLDSLFSVSSELNEGASADITGMIGQYAHGNEPGHHIIYLYSYVDREDKMADRLRQVCDMFYTTGADGLIGNEDCGQMSAWYIFTSLGFYPVNPVDGTFVLGSPLADRETLHLANGKEFTVIVHDNSADNRYISSVTLNRKPYDSPMIRYDDIMAGGILEIVMADTPRQNVKVTNPRKANGVPGVKHMSVTD